MVIRQQFGYPPFYRLILIRMKHQDYQKLNPAAAELAAMLRPIFKQDLLGPEYPVVSRVKNLYIKQMMVKFRRDYNTQKVKELIAQQIRLFQQNSEYKSVQVQVDVDPMQKKAYFCSLNEQNYYYEKNYLILFGASMLRPTLFCFHHCERTCVRQFDGTSHGIRHGARLYLA